MIGKESNLGKGYLYSMAYVKVVDDETILLGEDLASSHVYKRCRFKG